MTTEQKYIFCQMDKDESGMLLNSLTPRAIKRRESYRDNNVADSVRQQIEEIGFWNGTDCKTAVY